LYNEEQIGGVEIGQQKSTRQNQSSREQSREHSVLRNNDRRGNVSVPFDRKGNAQIERMGTGRGATQTTEVIEEPTVTRILKIDKYNETKLDELRRETYALERRGIQQEVGGIFHTYTATSFGRSGYQSRSSVQSQRYNDELGVERGRGGKTTSRVKEILFDDDGNEISRSYRKESKLERDEITVRDMLATNLEELAVTKTEKKRIAEYRGKLDEQSESILLLRRVMIRIIKNIVLYWT